jgi:hypothetical protein
MYEHHQIHKSKDKVMMEFDQSAAEMLCKAYDGALKALSEAESVLWSLPDHPEKEEYIRAYTGTVMAILSKLRAPIVIQFRHLDTNRPEGPPDTELDAEEQQIVSTLTEAQVALIDQRLLEECSSSWRKVARVAGPLFLEPPDGLPSISDGYLAQRVQALVAAGRLESRGNLDYMRFSEVRLPS